MAVSAAAATAEPDVSTTAASPRRSRWPTSSPRPRSALLVHFGGIWNLLANIARCSTCSAAAASSRSPTPTRGSSRASRTPSSTSLATQPIDWELLLVAAGLFLLMWGLKAAEFHGLCRFVGLEGSLGQHARAWFYGHGVNRLVPYEAGQVAKAEVLEGQGGDPVRAAQAVHLSSLMMAAPARRARALRPVRRRLRRRGRSQLFWAFVDPRRRVPDGAPGAQGGARAARREALRAAVGRAARARPAAADLPAAAALRRR